MLRRSWVEVSLDVLETNYNIYKSQLPTTQEAMAVVKADAYGHGECKVAERLQKIGCKHFAVSNIDEGILLRKAGVKGQILILGYTPISSADDLLEYDITQTLLSEDYAERLKDKRIKAQFAIDTGMNRIGLDADNPDECERVIRKYAKAFDLTGLFTHLCVADTESERAFTSEQIEKFKTVAERIVDLELPYLHCMNSAGGLWCEPYGNLTRLGIVLYGLKPDYSNVLPAGIKPVLQWKSVVSMVKRVYPGETIGYGRTYKVKKEMVIATIPTGYADGYNRLLSNKGKVLINGRTAPIVGRVCMDQMMVDVTGLDVSFEDEVTLLGEGYNADEMAQDIGTIGYEVICDISKRVPKLYI
jgi:alanine racemase